MHRLVTLACACPFIKVKLALSAQFGLTVALATVHRPALAGLEWYFGLFATLGTYYGVHLPPRPVAVATISVAV